MASCRYERGGIRSPRSVAEGAAEQGTVKPDPGSGHQTVLDNFFRYFWLDAPAEHPYPVTKLPDYDASYNGATAIGSLQHLKWGLHRLLWTDFSISGTCPAYRRLREMSRTQLASFFESKRFDSQQITNRGPALPLRDIPRDDRYLISEMACKSFGDRSETPGQLGQALRQAYLSHVERRGGPVTARQLISQELPESWKDHQQEFLFSADDVLDETFTTEKQIDDKLGRVVEKFFAARDAAMSNTRYYLSMVNDLDVYVATSMRNREQFAPWLRFAMAFSGMRNWLNLNSDISILP